MLWGLGLGVGSPVFGQGEEGSRPPRRGSAEAVEEKLRKLNEVPVGKVSLRDKPVKEALAVLEGLGREVDVAEAEESGKGVRMEVGEGVDLEAQVNLELTKVPLGEALRYVAALVKARLTYQEGAVVLVSAGPAPEAGAGERVRAEPAVEEEDGQLTVRLYPVEEAWTTRVIAPVRAAGGTARDAAVQAGVAMPMGAGVVYHPGEGQLIVRHREAGHRQIQNWIEGRPIQ